MRYKKYIISSFVLISALIAKSAYAICPVCTVAVGAGLGLAEYFGIDDSISGLWIGALLVSMSLWTINWLNTKNIKFKGRKILIFIGYYVIVILPLWLKGKIGHPYHKVCGVDKLLFGIVLGSILFSIGVILHNIIRKRNNNVSYFKGQKIAFPLALLVIASIILYYSCQLI